MTPHRRIATALTAALLVTAGLAWQAPTAPAAAAPAPQEKFPEVAQVPVFGHNGFSQRSGWLILNPLTRRGYQITEESRPSASNPRTVIHSFDLDTLQLRRRVELAGAPIVGGTGSATGVGGTTSAEVVHAVDPEGHRFYLALSHPQAFDAIPATLVAALSMDGRRPLTRFVAIDEDALDRGDPAFAASFRAPALQEGLHPYWVAGMGVARHHVPKGAVARLLVLLAPPIPSVTGVYFDHTLAQWDVSALRFSAAAALETAPPPVGVDVAIPGQLAVQQAAAAGLPRRLDACRNAPLASSGSSGQGQHQWGLLVLRDAVWTACQAAEGAGAVTRVPFGADGLLDPAAVHDLFRLSAKIADVLPDAEGRRLLVRSFGNGHTWWTFDTAKRRFTGAVAAKVRDSYTDAVGVDPTTGRFYQLMQDYEYFLDGRTVPFRGGFSYSDTRLDPPPALENARPDLAYPAGYAIRVDPVTRRVFVRFGHQAVGNTPVYPGTDSTTPAPQELSYRVLLDNVPPTPPPAQADDAAFTTDVAENNLTRASYLGTGSGYGTRAYLVGGLDAAANRTPVVGHQESPCGRDDRELVVGTVRSVEVSDISAAAEAAGLDGDAKSQDQLGRPVNRCTPEGFSGPAPDQLDTTELAFDDAAHKGQNLYKATCTGDGKDSATAPPDKRIPRDEFLAGATCEQARGKADAGAKGALSLPELDAAQRSARGATPDAARNQVPADHVRVGYAQSHVDVVREAGKGVTVKVEAISRDIVLPGIGTIGAVRAEATSTATGRRGGARSTYARSVCDIRFEGFVAPRCYDEDEQAGLERDMNKAMGSRGRVRFRAPDPTLLAGSPSGYKSGVQRPADDLFEDAKIGRDTSLALPAMEVVLYNGDSGAGTGRQFLHLAGVQAGTSYGIACLYGQRADGRCAAEDDEAVVADDEGGTSLDGSEPEIVTVTEPGGFASGPVLGGGGAKQSILRRLVEAPFRIAAEALRLLFSNPREFGLLAAVWALGYLPCHLADRRRRIASVRALRAATGEAIT